MAVGDLTPDQADYVNRIAQGTGLDKTVVVSWLGAESHWGVTKADHNYLNIGPGHTYASADQASAAVIGMINNPSPSSFYKGIKAAIGIGPLAQIAAIKSSPWDAGHYSTGAFDKIYSQLAGTAAATRTIPDPMAPQATPVDTNVVPDISGMVVNGIGGLAGSLFKGVIGSDIGKTVVIGGLTIAFAVAGLGLVAMGLSRLTSKSPSEHLDSLQGLFGAGKQAAELAALA